MAYEASAIVKNLIISVSTSYSQLQKLDKYCQKHAITRSEALRDALEMLLWCEDVARDSAQQEVDAYFDAQQTPEEAQPR
ncbi:MAG: ribbon-helix-helix domain-containing protein [Candidatus Limivicinus sp.]